MNPSRSQRATIDILRAKGFTVIVTERIMWGSEGPRPPTIVIEGTRPHPKPERCSLGHTHYKEPMRVQFRWGWEGWDRADFNNEAWGHPWHMKTLREAQMRVLALPTLDP